MARNEEKRFSALNRFLEGKREAEGKTKPQRPPLHGLETAEQVRQWIPSINREIDYCLEQLSGVKSRDYPDYKRKEFEERVRWLEREHKRFVEKVHALDPGSRGTVPWQPRAYSRKRPRDSDATPHDSHMTQTARVTAGRPCHPKQQRLTSPFIREDNLGGEGSTQVLGSAANAEQLLHREISLHSSEATCPLSQQPPRGATGATTSGPPGRDTAQPQRRTQAGHDTHHQWRQQQQQQQQRGGALGLQWEDRGRTLASRTSGLKETDDKTLSTLGPQLQGRRECAPPPPSGHVSPATSSMATAETHPLPSSSSPSSLQRAPAWAGVSYSSSEEEEEEEEEEEREGGR